MVTLRKRVRTSIQSSATQEKSNYIHEEETQSGSTREVSGYEQCRDQRIKENLERMQKLGIFDLSVKLKSEILSNKRTPRRSPKALSRPSPSPSPQPARRSSRLQNVTPVSYSERPAKKQKPVRDVKSLVGKGPKPEIYTEEDEKLLGTCNEDWTLFVDGYGKDGRRIYDQVKGKTCHQCRQKTLGHRTHCSKCSLVQGQFCGDCLYMRYGENVIEANKNPNWVCPVCRGICNCSLCRQAKGWPATGSLYRTVSNLGFKSVAHYLIQTRRSQIKPEEESCIDPPPLSAKRSVTFEGAEENSNSSKIKPEEESCIDAPPLSAKRSVTFEGAEENSNSIDFPTLDNSHHEILKPDFQDEKATNEEIKGKDDKQVNLGSKPSVSNAELNSDSIAGRLRPRRNTSK